MATLLDGRSLAASLRRDLKTKVAQLNFTPKLGVILVGDDPASHLYVRLKEQAAQEVGIAVDKVLLPASASLSEVINQVKNFNERPDIQAILVQWPLPAQLDEQKVINALDPDKDADGFHPQNLKLFLSGQPAIIPGVSLGIIKLIESAGQELKDKTAVLIVNSQEFAQPLVKLLHDRSVRTEVVTGPISDNRLHQADIIVVARGVPRTITAEQVKDNSIIIDVGTTRIGDQVVGDVDAAGFNSRPVFLTPVPGGVGPMTVAMLLWNVYYLAAQKTAGNGHILLN